MTNSIPVEFLTKGYFDARHLAARKNKGLAKSEDKNPKVTSYTKPTSDLEQTFTENS